MKYPSFPFYPDEFLSSNKVTLMNPTQIGAYILLLCHEWNDPNCRLPNDDIALARYSRLYDDWDTHKKIILSCFTKRSNYLYNLKLLKERRKVVEWKSKLSEAGKRTRNLLNYTPKTKLTKPRPGSSQVQARLKPARLTPTPSPRARANTTTTSLTVKDGEGVSTEECVVLLSPYFPKHKIDELLSDVPSITPVYIKEKIDILNSTNNVKSPHAFLISCLKYDYKSKQEIPKEPAWKKRLTIQGHLTSKQFNTLPEESKKLFKQTLLINGEHVYMTITQS